MDAEHEYVIGPFVGQRAEDIDNFVRKFSDPIGPSSAKEEALEAVRVRKENWNAMAPEKKKAMFETTILEHPDFGKFHPELFKDLVRARRIPPSSSLPPPP